MHFIRHMFITQVKVSERKQDPTQKLSQTSFLFQLFFSNTDPRKFPPVHVKKTVAFSRHISSTRDQEIEVPVREILPKKGQ